MKVLKIFLKFLEDLVWTISSRPKNLGRIYSNGDEDDNGIQNGYDIGP